MRKNFLTAVAAAVTAFLVGTTVAQAASVEFGGELRPRFEYNEQSNFNSANGADNGGTTTGGDYFISSRIRLHAKADILPDTSAFIQLQSTRVWGNDVSGPGTAPAGAGNAAFSPSDGDASVGVHQAYFTLKNFASLPADLQVGRQEVVLDGHRILGNTGWTQGAQTHDAVRVNHSAGNVNLAYVYSLANEGGRTGNNNDHQDVEAHVVYANMQGILGGGLSLYFVGLDDDCSSNTAGTACGSTTGAPLDNNNYTVGVRQAGQLFGLDYRAEFYYQFGDAEGDALAANGTTGVGTPYTVLIGNDRSAYMFGARVGKKFTSVMWKPSLTFWYDYLSGTSDEDARDGDYKTFNTLFDTGHKFYGLMDLFLPATGTNTNHLGLVDYAIKATIAPRENWTLKADWHYFTTAEGIEVNPNFSASTVGSNDGNELGSELDLTLVHKYNANTTVSLGWSQFWQEQGFELLNAISLGDREPAQWAYLMFDVKF